MKLGIVVLAAGRGTRMKSRLPKVLHDLGGKPLLAHVLETAKALRPAALVVVYGHGGERVRAAIDDPDITWVLQPEQNGTGDAVRMALPALANVDRVLVLYGDVPLLRPASLWRLLEQGAAQPLAIMTVVRTDPTGYGRIVRDTQGRIQRIVEQKDASQDELAIDEVNTGIMLIARESLQRWLHALQPNNAQGEYYLTDVVSLAVSEGVWVQSSQPDELVEAEGVNDREQLASLERALQARRARRLMQAGVSLRDPARFDVRGQVVTSQDVTIDTNVILEGEVELGTGVRIGANCRLRNVRLGDDVCILDHCVIEDAVIEAGCQIGPFARIRPGTHLKDGVRVGNFVEIKKAHIDTGAKINHLSYIGDTQMGAGVNIGAGTITCNYDGANKHPTHIGEGAFIGSNTALVAPVRIGAGATIGAGSVITKDAPAEALSLARAKQITIENWTRPTKE